MGWWPFADFLASLFVPLLVAGLACGVVWRFVPPGRLRTRLQIASALLFFVPQLPVIFLLYRSMALLLYGEAVLAAWMLAIAGLVAWKLTTPERRVVNRRTRAQSPAVLAVIGVVMGSFGLVLGWQFVADAFLPHQVVEGPVVRITPRYGSRAPRLFDIVIGNEAVHVTHDVASGLRPGDQVRAEVGSGSHALLSVQKLGR